MQIYFLIVNINVGMKHFHLNLFVWYNFFVFIVSLRQSRISEILVLKIERLLVVQNKDNVDIIRF